MQLSLLLHCGRRGVGGVFSENPGPSVLVWIEYWSHKHPRGLQALLGQVSPTLCREWKWPFVNEYSTRPWKYFQQRLVLVICILKLKLKRVTAQKWTCNSYTQKHHCACSLPSNVVLKILGSLLATHGVVTTLAVSQSHRRSWLLLPTEGSGRPTRATGHLFSLDFPGRRGSVRDAVTHWVKPQVKGNKTFLTKFLFSFDLCLTADRKYPFSNLHSHSIFLRPCTKQNNEERGVSQWQK